MAEPLKIDIKRIERIKIMIKDKKLSQAQFARSIGMSPENLSRIINRHVNFTETTAKLIISYYPEYNLEWLLGYSDLKTQEVKTKAEYAHCDVMAKEKKISEILVELADDICNNYCKYPNEWDEEEHDGLELFDSEICQNCPLTRLI